jgi:site-specific DNA recombinase
MRIREIDKQVRKLMLSFAKDLIPAELLSEHMGKLNNEKSALQASLAVKVEVAATPFDLTEKLAANAVQVWEFANESEKRKILESLISRITLTDKDIKIEWAF